MQDLGTLVLKMQADRQRLRDDLEQSESLLQSYADRFNQTLKESLTLGLGIDESSVLSSMRSIGLRVQSLRELLSDSLVIKVDDDRLTELNAHFRLKEADYKHLQSVFLSPLTIRVDDSQITSARLNLQALAQQQSIELRTTVDRQALESFHKQLASYTQARTISLATTVSSASLIQLRQDLQDISSSATTAKVAVRVDNQLDALRQGIGSIGDIRVGVHVDDAGLKKINGLTDNHKIKIDNKIEGTRDLSRTIEHAVKDGLGDGIRSGGSAITAPFRSVMRGAFEGLGRELFGGISKSFSTTLNQSLGNTIGSPELVGRKLAERGVAGVQNVANQLGAEQPAVRSTIAQIQQEIRQSLGEREVAIAANKTRGIEQKRQQTDLKTARGGVLGEFRAADEEKNAATLDAVAAYRSTRAEQAKINELDAPFQAKLADIARRKGKAQQEFIKQKEKELAALEQRLAASESPAAQQAILAQMQTQAGQKFSGAKYDNEERIVQQQRAPIQARQDAIDSVLEPAAARVQVAEDRYANAYRQANLLKRQQQPKVVQDILDEIAPGLPDHQVPKLISDPALHNSGVEASYSPTLNRVRLNPTAYRQVVEGDRLSESTYKSLREEYEHAKDFKFGAFEGFEARGEFRLPGNKREKAQPHEEAAIAQELEQYDPKVRIIERNAKIRRDRGYKKYAAEQNRQAIENFVGLGGNQFEASYNPSGIASNVVSLKSAAGRRGINFPSLAKLENKAQQLQVEHHRLREQISLALNGQFNEQELAKLASDLEAQAKAVISTKQRIAGAQKQLIKTVEFGDKGYQKPLPTASKDAIARNRGEFDTTFPHLVAGPSEQSKLNQLLKKPIPLAGVDATSLNIAQSPATTLSQATVKKTASDINTPSIAKLESKTRQLLSERRRLLNQIDLVLSGQADEGEIKKLIADLDAQIKSTTSANKRIAAAQKGATKRLEIGGKTSPKALPTGSNKKLIEPIYDAEFVDDQPNLSRQLLGHGVDALRGGYSFLQGAENVALGLIPGGRAAKALAQHTVLPAAAFHVAANALPGGQVLSHGLQSGLHALMGVPGAGLGASAHGLIESTLGQLPMMGGGISSATSALASGAIDMATSAGASVLAPILGGKAIFNVGQQAINMLPSQQREHHQMLAAGEAVGRALAPAAPATKQLVQQGRNAINAAGAKLITQSVEPLETFALPAASQRVLPPPPKPLLGSTKPEGYNPRSVVDVELAPPGVQLAGDIRSGTAGAPDAVKRAKEIRDKFNAGFKAVQQAIKAGDADRAAQYGDILTITLNRGEQEIRDLTQALGPAGKNTKAASQLGQSKSQLSQVRNKLARLYNTGQIAAMPRSIEQQLAEEELANLTPEQVRAISANELYKNPVQEFPTGFSSPARTRNRRQLKRRMIESRREVGNYEQTMLPDQYARSQAQTQLLNESIGPTAIQPPATGFSRNQFGAKSTQSGFFGPPSTSGFGGPAIQLPSTFDPNNPDPSWPTGFFSPRIQSNVSRSGASSIRQSVAEQQTILQPDNNIDTRLKPQNWIQRVQSTVRRVFNRDQSDPIEKGIRATMSAEKNLAKFERAEANIQALEAKNLGSMAVGIGGGSESVMARIFRVIRAESSAASGDLQKLSAIGGNVLKTFGLFAGLAGTVAILGRLGGGAIDAAMKMESLENSIIGIASSRTEADRIMSVTRQRSEYLGQNYASSLESTRGFIAATKGTNTEAIGLDIVGGFSQQAAAGRIGADRTKNLLLGLQQMAAKGEQPSQEELRQQVAESSPLAIGSLARGSGMNVTQLYRAVDEKTISTTDLLSRGAQQASAESAGGALLASRSAEASMGNLQTSINDLNVAVGDNFLGVAKVGMDTASGAAKLLKEHINELGKVFLAAMIAGSVGAVSLAGGLSLASPLVGMLVKGLIVAGPALAAFALQAGVAYTAIDLLSTISNSLSDNSPGKEFADSMVAELQRITEAAGKAGNALGNVRTKDEMDAADEKRYGKDRTIFSHIGDFTTKSLRYLAPVIGDRLTTSVEQKKADSIIGVAKGLETGEQILSKKEDSQSTQRRIDAVANIDRELSILRAENARLTSKDGDKLVANEKRTQELVKQKYDIEKPRAERSGSLETTAKNLRSQIDDQTLPQTFRDAARDQLTRVEVEQRQISQQFNTTARDMVENLRRLSASFVTANQAIERQSLLSRVESNNLAARDPLNTGAATRSTYQISVTEQSAKIAAANQAIAKIEPVLNTQQNQRILKTLRIDPKNFSQEDLDQVSKNFQDDQGKALIQYFGKYKSALDQLDRSNEQLSSTQSGYAKALADYNKAYTDKLISLRAQFVSSVLSASSKLASLSQGVDESVLDIDRTRASTLAKEQKTKLQAGYNRFLTKLGMATDSLFDTIFGGFDDVLSIFDEINGLALEKRSSAMKAQQRRAKNEQTYGESYYQTQQDNERNRREYQEQQRSNPANTYNGNTTVGTGAFRVSSPVPGLSLQQAIDYQGLPVQRPNANRLGRPGGHDAIDYGALAGVKLGTPVLATFDGTATYTPNVSYYNGTRTTNQVMLSGQGPKGDRLDAKYFHLGDSSEFFRDAERQPNGSYVKRVRAGEPIGRVGGDGAIGGNDIHLDFTTYINGKKVKDPREFLRQLMQQTQASPGAGIKITTDQAENKEAAGKGYKSTTRPVSGTDSNWRNVTMEDSDARYRQSPVDRFKANSIPTVRPRKVRSTPRAISPPRTINPSTTTYQSPVSNAPTTQSGGYDGYTDVVSSWYTPGVGGAINGGFSDMRGKYINSESLVMATRTTDSPMGIPYGAKVEIRDPKSGRRVVVENRDRGTLRPGRDIDLTPAAAKRLGITPDGISNLQMRVLSVPNGKVASSYDLGSGIGKYDGQGRYVGPLDRKISTIPQSQPISKNVYTASDIDRAGTSQESQIQAQETLGNETLVRLRGWLNIDNQLADRQRQVSDQQTDASGSNLRQRAIGTSLRLRNKLKSELYTQDRRTNTLIEDTSAINRSRDRSGYQSMDRMTQDLGGVADRSTVDQNVVEGQQFTSRIVNDRRDRGQDLLNQISKIEADGAGWDSTRKTLLQRIADARKKGDEFQVKLLESMVQDTDNLIGTPQSRQRKINALSTQYRQLPSAGIAAYDAASTDIKPALIAGQELARQYLPTTFDSKIAAEARDIVDRFAAVKKQTLLELEKLNSVVTLLESEIQAKLAAAGYGPQKLDTNDPQRLALLNRIAPQQTSALVAARGNVTSLQSQSDRLDKNVQIATSRSQTIANIRDRIAVERESDRYYAQTQQGDLFTTRQLDVNKYAQGKQELELDFQNGVISAEMYAQKLRLLQLETNTLRNAMLPLRDASNNFFSDIFKGKDILSGLGDAFRNFSISVLQQIQGMVSQHLGQQLFGSLLGGATDIANDRSDSNQFSVTNIARSAFRAFGLNDTRGDLSLRPPSSGIPSLGSMMQHDRVNPASGGFNFGSAALGIASSLFLPAFADGGMVTGPTVALVGEGLHNEAIVPLPNGRSIPVDLKNASSGGASINNSSSVAVTINNTGSNQSLSRQDGAALAGLVDGAVYRILMEESRAGGILNR